MLCYTFIGTTVLKRQAGSGGGSGAGSISNCEGKSVKSIL